MVNYSRKEYKKGGIFFSPSRQLQQRGREEIFNFSHQNFRETKRKSRNLRKNRGKQIQTPLNT
jgi:hypothetical protein